MKTERQSRLETELNKVDAALLDQPMHDLANGEEIIADLVSEGGYASAKSYLNDASHWGRSLREVVEYLVDGIYTLDGVTYETKAEMQTASLA